MKKYITLIFVLFISQTLIAQKPPIKWKEVPIEDLKMSSYSLDTSASAVVLCDYGQYYFDINPNGQNLFLFNKRHLRIKILKKEGLKYAKMRIPFMDKTCEKLPEENSIVIKGLVYNLSKSGELEATKLKRKNILYKDSVNCMQIAEFEMPNVKIGSVIDYYYEKPTLDFITPKAWYFQREIPVRHSELRVKSPRYFQYMFSPVNFENFDVLEEKNYSRTLIFTPKYSYYRYNRSYNFDLSGKELQFIKINNEATSSKGFTINPKKYLEKLNIHLVKATNENFSYAWQYITHYLFATTVEGYENYEPIQRRSIIYPAGYIFYNLHDWEKVTEKLLKSDRFGLPLIKHWDYQPHLNNMIEGKESDYDKMLAIYNHVRRNIKWNGEYDIYVRSVFNPALSKIYTKVTKKVIKEKSLKRPFEAKEGSSSEANFILISLLNKAQIEAHPVLISTRDNEKVDINIPDPRQFNHVIALAKIGDEEFLLDATDSIRPYYLLDKNHLVKDAFLVKGKDFGWLETKNLVKTSTIVEENILIDDNLNIKQSFRIKSTGYDAIELRRKINSSGPTSTKKLINELIGTEKIDSIKNMDEEELPLIFTTEISKKFSENEYIIKPKINLNYSQEDFTEYIRKHPMEFQNPYKKSFALEIILKDSLECELPKNESFTTFGNNAYFTYTSSKEKNLIKLSVVLEIKLTSFPNTEYANIEQLFTQLNEKLQEKIIIRKKKKD